MVQVPHYLNLNQWVSKLIGIDFDEKMCNMTRENLKLNNFKSKVLKSDFNELLKISNNFDAIVTDLPYGKSSKTSEKPEEILKRFISIVPKNKKIAIMFKKELDSKMKLKGLKNIISIGIKV